MSLPPGLDSHMSRAVTPCLTSPPGKVSACAEALRVLMAENPLDDGQQLRKLVASTGRVPSFSGPPCEVVARYQCVRVLGP